MENGTSRTTVIHQHVACCPCLDWSFDFDIFDDGYVLMWSGWPSKLSHSPNCGVNNPETSSSKQNRTIPLAVSCHQCLIYHHTLTSTGFGTGRPRRLMERFTKSIASCTANPVNAASAQCMARWRLHVAINQHLKIRLKADTWLSSSLYVNINMYIYICVFIFIFISIYVYCTYIIRPLRFAQ